ncbi:MAG: glycosyltransferase, partial [Succinivibrio sp.]
MNKYCIIIPCYRHTVFLESVLSKLLKFNLPVIVVDDGNEVKDKKLIENTVKTFDNVYLESYEENKGKGYAFIQGLYKALNLGFTHAIQIDADGQHDSEDIDRLTALSDMYPDCVISGAPVYDESAPFS